MNKALDATAKTRASAGTQSTVGKVNKGLDTPATTRASAGSQISMGKVNKALDATTPAEVMPSHDVMPLRRSNLHEELVGRIRDMIIEGQLLPGARIHEGQLGAALGVSRTPLREALKFLASEGLIDLVPGRGAVVHKLTAKDVRDMLDVLAALETLGGRLTCRHASADDIARVRKTHDEMMRFYAARNRLEYYRRNQAIHSAFVQLSGNALLASMHQVIQGRLKRIRFIGNEGKDKWAGAVSEHQAMIAALEARNEKALAKTIARHLQETWRRVEDKL